MLKVDNWSLVLCRKGDSIMAYHKLTEQDVIGIWVLWWGGLYIQQEIADTYNVTRSNIGHIINNKTWKHIWEKVL